MADTTKMAATTPPVELVEVVARVHAGRGDRAAERRALDEAMIRARRGGVPTVMAGVVPVIVTIVHFPSSLMVIRCSPQPVARMAE